MCLRDLMIMTRSALQAFCGFFNNFQKSKQRIHIITQEFPNLRQPAIVGEFSLDSNREFIPDRWGIIGEKRMQKMHSTLLIKIQFEPRSGLGYIRRPQDPDRVQMDLSHGLERSNFLGFCCGPWDHQSLKKKDERWKVQITKWCCRVIRKGEAAQGGAEGLTNLLQCILKYR